MKTTMIALMVALTTAGAAPQFHPPLTADQPETTPRQVQWQEPPALALPSAEELKTVTVKGRTFHITKVSKGSEVIFSKKPEEKAKLAQEGVAIYEAEDEALFFNGTGGGGRKSAERLIVEDCVFTIDFQEGNFVLWDPRRSAIYVRGYKEVLVRNCIFISTARLSDPVRKVQASLNIEDCVRVQVEDCYFEGLTNWMRGHVTIFASGQVSIRRCEVAGMRQGNNLVCGGGLWVANGIGEGKLGSPPHAGDPELLMYPSGPLLIEDCWVHDQKGSYNTDGIYVQSIHGFLIRNTKVENWQEDSLIDIGFRDSARGTYEGKPLVNHGALGLIEHCEFAKGYLKDSVGAGGGIIVRHNLIRDAWIFPYIFDGGSWWVIGNEFTDLSGVIVSGYNDQTSGWVPKEGMLIGGSRLYFYNNRFETRAGAAAPALFVSTPIPEAPLKGNIIADYNVYDLKGEPALFGDDRAIGQKYGTFEEWQKGTGNDTHSLVGGESLAKFASVDPGAVKLPGGFKAEFGEVKAGLTGPVGPRPEIAALAKKYSAQVAVEMKEAAAKADAVPGQPPINAGTYQMEEVRVVEAEGGEWTHSSNDASAGKYRLWQPKQAGQAITFAVTVFEGGKATPRLYVLNLTKPVKLQLLVDGEEAGAPVVVGKSEGVFEPVTLTAGEHAIGFRLLEPAAGAALRLDRLDLTRE